MASKKIKQDLHKKLSEGWTVQEACEQLGIPEEKGKELAEEILKKSSQDDSSLHLLAFDSLKTGIEKLKQIVVEGPRYSESGAMGSRVESVDLIAAKSLVDAGLKIRALIGKTKEKAAELDKDKGGKSQPDLWDLYGPWRLKKPEEG